MGLNLIKHCQPMKVRAISNEAHLGLWCMCSTPGCLLASACAQQHAAAPADRRPEPAAVATSNPTAAVAVALVLSRERLAALRQSFPAVQQPAAQPVAVAAAGGQPV